MNTQEQFFAEVRLAWAEDPNGVGQIVRYRLEEDDIVVQSVTHGDSTYRYDQYELHEIAEKE